MSTINIMPISLDRQASSSRIPDGVLTPRYFDARTISHAMTPRSRAHSRAVSVEDSDSDDHSFDDRRRSRSRRRSNSRRPSCDEDRERSDSHSRRRSHSRRPSRDEDREHSRRRSLSRNGEHSYSHSRRPSRDEDRERHGARARGDDRHHSDSYSRSRRSSPRRRSSSPPPRYDDEVRARPTLNRAPSKVGQLTRFYEDLGSPIAASSPPPGRSYFPSPRSRRQALTVAESRRRRKEAGTQEMTLSSFAPTAVLAAVTPIYGNTWVWEEDIKRGGNLASRLEIEEDTAAGAGKLKGTFRSSGSPFFPGDRYQAFPLTGEQDIYSANPAFTVQVKFGTQNIYASFTGQMSSDGFTLEATSVVSNGNLNQNMTFLRDSN